MPEFLAHPDQPLPCHLCGVAMRAQDIAKFFSGEGQARIAGLLHDLGKAEDEFLKRITGEKGKEEPHAHHGAAMVLEDTERGGPIWPVAFAINGHHAGLHDRHNVQKRRTEYAKAQAAEKRLSSSSHWKDQAWPLSTFGKNLPQCLEELPFTTPEQRSAKLRAVDVYIRFLFSALVDADRLDTEENDPQSKQDAAQRRAWRFGSAALAAEGAVNDLQLELGNAIQKRRKEAVNKGASSEVLAVRTQVLDHCKTAADMDRGIFSLTVPTGGGKTLASVDFALRHIQAQNAKTTDHYKKLRRIIVVIPYLSIIQQTARELKNVFGELDDDGKSTQATPVVLEHHSQAQDPPLDEKKMDSGKAGDYSRERSLRQLAAENWDAPIIVTTSVQFFDSLFSRRPADARKLHNIAQSVIIFDEVQTFPPRLMQPILDVLAELTNPVRRYGCSLVLCTATQPALSREVNDEPWAFDAGRVRPIVPAAEANKHFQALRRTVYPDLESPNEIPVLSWEQLATDMLQAPKQQGLVVVNTRKHARELFTMVQQAVRERHELEQDKVPHCVFHLSTWMTPAHRVDVLGEVNRRLKVGEPCFLVSTQCIEAGVDVDFPAVWRALGPYDSIVQAAGRCNRSGALKDAQGQPAKGVVRVFRPVDHDKSMPQGVYQTATSQTELLRRMKAADPHNPESFPLYFRLLYQLSVPDECEIQKHREQLHFEQVHESFDFIEAFSAPLLVTHHCVAGGNHPVRVTVGGIEMDLATLVANSRLKGFFTPAEWRCLQPHLLALDFRNSKTAPFLRQCATLVFKDDSPKDGLHRLTATTLYDGGVNGAGLDCLAQDLNQFMIL